MAAADVAYLAIGNVVAAGAKTYPGSEIVKSFRECKGIFRSVLDEVQRQA